jgi:branched-chain amino acid transport system substrate-binding protein
METMSMNEKNEQQPNPLQASRRKIIKAGATLAAALVAGAPGIVVAQRRVVKVGVLHPVTGAFAYSGNSGRAGAMLAIEEINARGGIASLGGAIIEPVLSDAQSRPEIGAAEVEKMNEAGVVAIVGPFVSSIALATTQAASRHNIPHVVDVGTADQIMERGLKNTFRFGPGIKTIGNTAIESFVKMNQAAGKPVKTVVIVHEESAFGTGIAAKLNADLPSHGLQVLQTIRHANPTRDFSNIALKIKSLNPDVVIPCNYYDEYSLLIRTLHQQRVFPKAIYSVLGGAANNYRFIREFPQQSANIIDCGHWIDARKPAAVKFMERVAAKKLDFTLELFLAYTATMYLADAIERAKSTDRQAIIDALANSTWNGHIMPYAPTKIVNGQNTGSFPVITQVQNGEVKVVFPREFANAQPIFPVPGPKV